ncbi:unnamed protein product [Clavelina lepadiformis]|uniref:JmjC domain-containing protein n=1 Tax=Clavelina lepadiformis TaxID=159417 RepID=A0ABP0FNC5_CLALP
MDCNFIDIKTYILNGCIKRPTIFRNFSQIKAWEALKLTPEALSDILNDKKIKFRIGEIKQNYPGVQWEGDCRYVHSTMKEFLAWIKKQNSGLDFKGIDPNECWGYADYIYMRDLFGNITNFDVFDYVPWHTLGFGPNEGLDSTIWIGTKRANTPCHYDTYGFNLVVQVFGSKRWVLFPPSDSEYLYPTRLPYEESSVFSGIDVVKPDVTRYPKYLKCHPYIVDLHPGDMLYVPQHWWHYVENMELSVSINAWFPMENDADNHICEAVTRLLVGSSMGYAENHDIACCNWLNPTETMTSLSENVTLLDRALVQRLNMKAIYKTSPVEENRVDTTQTGCGCDSETSHLQDVNGVILKRYCLKHAAERFQHWKFLDDGDAFHENIDSKRPRLNESNAQSLSSVTFRDFVECLSQPSVVDCVRKELLARVREKHSI